MFRGPDEIEHLLRGSGVALGEVLPPDTPPEEPGVLRADGTLVQQTKPVCTTLRKELDPSFCRPRSQNADGTVDAQSTATRYLPTYYVALAPAYLAGGDTYPYLLRALSGLWCAIVLAWAWSLTALARKTLWGMTAMVVAMTPAVLFASIVVAPNGLQYAGALLLWSALMAMRRASGPSKSTALGAGAGGCLLAVTHTTGPLWLGLVLATWLTFIGWRTGYSLLWRQGPTARVAVATVLVSALSTVIWVWTFSTNAPGAGEPLVAETKAIGVIPNTVLWVLQTIGVMPYRFGILWPVVYVLWLLPLVVLVVSGFKAADGRARASMGVAVAASVAVPAAATVLTYEVMGFGWQGRYGLPLLFGIVLVAGEVLDDREISLDVRGLAAGFMWLATTQYLCLLCLGLRESRGPFADGRPWPLLMWLVAPLLVASAYGIMVRAQIGALSRAAVLNVQSSPSENADSRS